MTYLLTRTERIVIAEIAKDGATDQVIATRLWVERNTIKFHLSNAMRKVNPTQRTRTAMALWWIREGQYQASLDGRVLVLKKAA